MAVLNRNEYFSSLNTFIGDNRSPEAVEFLENMSDTFNSLEQGASNDGVDWKAKYEESEKKWQDRYMHRFFSGDAVGGFSVEPESMSNVEEDKAQSITVDDLFN